MEKDWKYFKFNYGGPYGLYRYTEIKDNKYTDLQKYSKDFNKWHDWKDVITDNNIVNGDTHITKLEVLKLLLNNKVAH